MYYHIYFTLITFVEILTAANVIELPQGKIQGFLKKSYDGRPYLAFEGIPYAKPPVGPLRFAGPKPAEKWDGTLIGNKSYVCLQYYPIPVFGFASGTEDCLYLYVYVPRSKIDPNENLHVIVNLHGGGFLFGDPVNFAGPDYVMDKDVIFVSLNYRLSILGFLSTEDDVVPGNNGLKDQSLALKWIRDNINYFGGNPDSVTLSGLSSGAVSVHLHYLSPLSKGLFHRGFSQSGTALLPWAIIEKPLEKAKIIAEHFSCPVKSTGQMVSCLRKIDGNKLISATKILTMDFIPYVIFGPVVEKGSKPFLPEHPYKLLLEGKVYDVPWVVSNVKDEGIFPTNIFMAFRMWDQLDNSANAMAHALDLHDTVDKNDLDDVVTKIKHFYFKDESLSDKVIYLMVKLITDRLYLLDTEKAIRVQAKVVKSPIYYLLFAYEPIDKFTIPAVPYIKGVGHGEDAMFLTTTSYISRVTKPEDVQMMRLFTEFIASYAKGNNVSFNNVKWIPVSPNGKELQVLRISSPSEIKMQNVKQLAPQKFWASLPIHENDKIL